MSKHTAGPWAWNEKQQLVSTTVFDEPFFDDDKPAPVVIIETDGGFYPPRGPDRHLLAAAPEMYRLLRAICDSASEAEGYRAIMDAKALLAQVDGAA